MFEGLVIGGWHGLGGGGLVFDDCICFAWRGWPGPWTLGMPTSSGGTRLYSSGR